MLDFSIMTPSIAIFAVSGFSIMALFAAKGIEVMRKKPLFLLKAVKKADARLHTVHHGTLHFYENWKEQAAFFMSRQAPMRIKNSWNKMETFVRERKEEYLLKMRDARIIKRREGISEFYKNLASIERGNGEINETFGGDFQNEAK